MINDWNSLPSYIVNITSINIFKSLLDEHWKTSFMIVIYGNLVYDQYSQAVPFPVIINNNNNAYKDTSKEHACS